MQEIYDTAKKAIILILILWVMFALFIGVKMAPNDDMKPKIGAGDVLVFYRIDKTAKEQNVIVIRKNDTDYIGRVVAQAGDTVDITKDGILMINGNPVTEAGIYYDKTPKYRDYIKYPIELKADECFVLSDKRDNGEDSRYYGPVKKSEIKGTVIGQFRKNGI